MELGYFRALGKKKKENFSLFASSDLKKSTIVWVLSTKDVLNFHGPSNRMEMKFFVLYKV